MLNRVRTFIRKGLLACERGQAATEYSLITVAILGGGTLSWPFFMQLINAMNTYYQSVFAAIQSPLP